jgi:hypothetical protein
MLLYVSLIFNKLFLSNGDDPTVFRPSNIRFISAKQEKPILIGGSQVTVQAAAFISKVVVNYGGLSSASAIVNGTYHTTGIRCS